MTIAWRQGVRDAEMLLGVLKILFTQPHSTKAHQDMLLKEDMSMAVHMAIVTANIGKRLFVHEGCLLGKMLQKLNIASIAARTDEQCNCEIFTISNWFTCNEVCPLKEFSELDLQNLASTWNNTVSVTAKGSVIIRFSWKVPVEWTPHCASTALAASRMICWLILNCS